MNLPLQITFRNVRESDSIKSLILDRANQLDRHFGRIISCRVLVERPHHHHYRGNLFHLRIALRVPGKELVAAHSAAENTAHKDIYITIRDTFHDLRRQLEEYVRWRRGEVKFHEPLTHAVLTEAEQFQQEPVG